MHSIVQTAKKFPKEFKTGEQFMEKSLNIGDQLSQIVVIYYPNRMDTYVKFFDERGIDVRF